MPLLSDLIDRYRHVTLAVVDNRGTLYPTSNRNSLRGLPR